MFNETKVWNLLYELVGYKHMTIIIDEDGGILLTDDGDMPIVGSRDSEREGRAQSRCLPVVMDRGTAIGGKETQMHCRRRRLKDGIEIAVERCQGLRPRTHLQLFTELQVDIADHLQLIVDRERVLAV